MRHYLGWGIPGGAGHWEGSEAGQGTGRLVLGRVSRVGSGAGSLGGGGGLGLGGGGAGWWRGW